MAVLDRAVLRDSRRLTAVRRARRRMPALPMPLDAIARLAANLLGAPMGVVTLVGAEEEHFAGLYGLPQPLAAAGRASIAYSVCKYVVSADAPVCSGDMSGDDDPKLREHPLATEYGIRAFLGVPLRDADNVPVGSLTVLDSQARQWGDAQLSMLVQIARLLDPGPASTTNASPVVEALDAVSLLDGVQEACVAVDADAVVAGFNPAAQQLLGWDAAEVCGRPIAETVLPDYDGRPVEHALHRLFTAPPARLLTRLVDVRHRDGHRVPMRAVLSMVRGTAGALVCAFLTDLSAQVAAEQDAQRQRRFLAALLDSLDVGVAAVNIQGRVMVFNRALRDIHGLTDTPNEEQVATEVIAALFQPDGTPMLMRDTPWARALQGEVVRDEDVMVKVAGRRTRILAANAQQITDNDGANLGAVVALHEVTDIRRVQRFRDGQLDMAEALAGASSVSDAGPAVLRVIIEVLGWPHAELWLIDEVSDTLYLAAHATAPGLSLDHLLDFHVVKGAGVTGTVWATGAPVWVPDISDDAHVITQESLARAQALSELGVRTVLAVPVAAGDTLLGVLNCYAAAPEDDQDSLTVLLAGAATQLGQFLALRRSDDLATELDRAKDDFLTLVGHEMRTPLTSISSYTDMLLDEPRLDPDTRQMIDVIARNTGTLRGIVNDLLDLAALESGHAQLSTADLDLTSITTDAVNAAAATSPASVHLHPDLPAHLPVHGDAYRLRQVIDALISNAVKYSPDGGPIDIRLTAHDDVAELSVTDTGIGIPADDHDRLFDRFYRGRNARHSTITGSGLGLTRARIIVEAHHGTITLTAHHQRPGTTVTVRLPQYPRARPQQLPHKDTA